MKKYFSIIAVCAIFLMSSCKKDKNQIFISDFETQDDLAEWTAVGDGNATIEDGAVSFTDINSCFHLDVTELVDVKRNESYRLKISSKHSPVQVGDPAFCVGSLMIWVKQDSETLLAEGPAASDEFVEQQYTFTTESNSPVQIKIMVGTTHGAWVDYLSLEKVK